MLGPLLFLVYIDDVSNVLLSDGIYADDMLLYKSMKSFEDYSHLQLDIDCISDRVRRNKLMLNPTKCKAMTISRKRNSVYPAQFLLNGYHLCR